jgi:hypothetical protein
MDISKYDKTLDNAMFLTKVDNIFMLLYSAIMDRNLNKVKHRISDEIFERYEPIVKDLIEQKQIQMYGELNVKSSEIIDIEDKDDLVVTVKLITRYLDYIVDEDYNYISGDTNNREEHELTLKFKKRKDAEKLKASRHCPTCGALMDISKNGQCEFCGSIFNTEDYDWILIDINE